MTSRGSTVIVCDGTATVYALATSDGTPRWSRPLDGTKCDSTPAITPDYIVQYVWGSGGDYRGSCRAAYPVHANFRPFETVLAGSKPDKGEGASNPTKVVEE